MTTPRQIESSGPSLIRDWLNAVRYYLGGRWSLLILASIAVVAGIAFNWNWLVATGIAPILLTALPCALMCGLGLCFNRLFGGSCESESSSQRAAEHKTDTLITRLDGSVEPDGKPIAGHVSKDSAVTAVPKANQSSAERRDPHA